MNITVAEIMTSEPATLSIDDSLRRAMELMSRGGFRHLPIVDKAGALVGLVTQSDVLAASASNLGGSETERPAERIRIGEFMTRDVATVDERADLRETAIYLQRHKYGCLPVVTDGQLRGIVTDSDFVAVAINLLEQTELLEPDDY
jgi:CBS domain-containing protein